MKLNGKSRLKSSDECNFSQDTAGIQIYRRSKAMSAKKASSILCLMLISASLALAENHVVWQEAESMESTGGVVQRPATH